MVEGAAWGRGTHRGAQRRLLEDLLAAERVAHDVCVDRDRHVDRLGGYPRRRLAQDRPELALELADAGLARVAVDDLEQRVVGHLAALVGEAVIVELKPSDARLRIDVVDRGGGLTAEEQAVIFDAFVRGGAENERGTGPGLTLSRQLARLLGGELKVQSAPGAGARFIVELARFLTA